MDEFKTLQTVSIVQCAYTKIEYLKALLVIGQRTNKLLLFLFPLLGLRTVVTPEDMYGERQRKEMVSLRKETPRDPLS
jgi:hypothetical protein